MGTPRVSSGGVQVRWMHVLEALTIWGAPGGPERTEEENRAVFEQQPTVVGLPHDLHSTTIFDFGAIFEPTDHQSLLRWEGHLKGCILTHSDYHRLGEFMKLIWVKFRLCFIFSPISFVYGTISPSCWT
ncbi:hypothetical protein NQD34_003007 [Periophthalmus magnuspinnatus]|nr:hypothetical protein NQD34_003007 [Periophthalmus magnuspinnatus]